MRATLRKAAVFSALIIIGTHNMYAEEDFAIETAEPVYENVIVNSAPLSPEKRVIWMEMLREEAALEEQILQEPGAVKITGTVIPIKQHNLNDLLEINMNTTVANYSPYVYHWISSFPQANVLKLEDGSEWRFNEEDDATVRLWQGKDQIEITSNRESIWGSNVGFVLTNTDRNSSVVVNVQRGPREFGKDSFWVTTKDRAMGQVVLVNGTGEKTIWEVGSTDFDFFEEWLPNEHVIIGKNDSWLWAFSPHDHIIYNYNKDHYIHARFVRQVK